MFVALLQEEQDDGRRVLKEFYLRIDEDRLMFPWENSGSFSDLTLKQFPVSSDCHGRP